MKKGSKRGIRMIQRQRPVAALRLRLKMVLIITTCSLMAAIIIFLLFGTIGTPEQAKAAGTETIDSGSYIVNMGITPQTVANGLKPYGLVYDLVVNYGTPIKWIIEPTKIQDGTDFTYNAIAYKGGPFIIPAAYITATIKTRITYWLTQGVQGVYTTSAFSAPVYSDITSMPRMIIDSLSGKHAIIMQYFTNAGIPGTAYTLSMPDSLSSCHDLWVNPHGDPNWTTHGRLYNFVVNDGSFIWSQCHAVSMLEGTGNPVAPFEQLNFLSTKGLKCYGAGKCSALITETHAGGSTSPYTAYYPAEPIMQFMGTMNGACGGGSEQWYQPVSSGKWRATTKVLVATSDGVSPKQGVLMAYGPAFGLAGKGWAMYEGGHDLDGNGTTAEKVAAQRAFFNYLLFVGISKQLLIATVSVPSVFRSLESNTLSLTVTQGTPGYTYQWTSNVGGTFSTPTSASTNFTAPLVSVVTSGIFTCQITDACGRRNFLSRPFTITPSALPVSLLDFTVTLNKSNNSVVTNWKTATEKDNDYFTVERTRDGKNFTEVARIAGAGNSNIINSYTCTDRTPFIGTSYYRLKQTDFNGDYETFKMVPVTIEQKNINSILVYPNPFQHSFTVTFESDDAKEVQIALISMNGALLYAEKLQAIIGTNFYRFSNGENLNAGTYYIKVSDEKASIGVTKIVRGPD